MTICSLVANIVTTSKALVTTSDAPVTSSFYDAHIAQITPQTSPTHSTRPRFRHVSLSQQHFFP